MLGVVVAIWHVWSFEDTARGNPVRVARGLSSAIQDALSSPSSGNGVWPGLVALHGARRSTC